MKKHVLNIFATGMFFLFSVLFSSAGLAMPGDWGKKALSDTKGSLLQFRSRGHILGFTPEKVYMVGLGYALVEEFVGGNGVSPVTPATDTEKGKGPSLETVSYAELWDGITLHYEAATDGLSESIYEVAPGADPQRIGFRYNVQAEINKDGGLVLAFPHGSFTLSAPSAWQEIGGGKVPVEVAFERRSEGTIGFRVGSYDNHHPLIIDPVYRWHTFYGSADPDYGLSVAIENGAIYVTGECDSTWNGPEGQLPLHNHSGSGFNDMFVLKLDANGAYLWHTFYGASDFIDSGSSIAVENGAVYVTGHSEATWTGPSGQGPLHAHDGADDIFVLKLDANGAYLWHTFYGSADYDYGYALDIEGRAVYVTGYSYETWTGPNSEPPLHSHSGANDIFVLKLDANGATSGIHSTGRRAMIKDMQFPKRPGRSI